MSLSIEIERTQVVVQVESAGIAVELARTPVEVAIAGVGPQGPSGVSPTHTHTQASPASTWTINHNLGFRPSVELYDTGGAEIEAEVVHTSVNQAVVSFNTAIAGSARCV